MLVDGRSSEGTEWRTITREDGFEPSSDRLVLFPGAAAVFTDTVADGRLAADMVLAVLLGRVAGGVVESSSEQGWDGGGRVVRYHKAAAAFSDLVGAAGWGCR